MELTRPVLVTTRIAITDDVMPRQSETSPVANADNAGSGEFGHELARDFGRRTETNRVHHLATNLT